MAQPVCVHCGKKYGQRSTTQQCVTMKIEGPKPRYEGNGIIVSETTFGNQVKSGGGTGSYSGAKFGPDECVLIRNIWDGVSWRGGYDPFCTLRCALDYARTAYARTHSLRNVR